MNDKEKLEIIKEYIHKHNQKIKIDNEYIDMVDTINLLNIIEGKYE